MTQKHEQKDGPNLLFILQYLLQLSCRRLWLLPPPQKSSNSNEATYPLLVQVLQHPRLNISVPCSSLGSASLLQLPLLFHHRRGQHNQLTEKEKAEKVPAVELAPLVLDQPWPPLALEGEEEGEEEEWEEQSQKQLLWVVVD